MTLDPRRMAKKLARKAAKRKARLGKNHRPGQSRGSIWTAMLQGQVASWPLHESYVPKNLFEIGLGDVIISRRSGSQVALGVFLVDTGCLGVKNGFLRVVSLQEYENMVNHFREREPLVAVKPEYARKLIEAAVKYAADLGFEPHRDYESARAVFGAIDAGLCDTTFEFGRDGKPFYCSGPSESPARREQILDILTKRCGPDQSHFIVGVGDSSFDDSDDDEVDDSDD